MSRRALIIDHVFHQKTKSFSFLFDVLSRSFTTKIAYVDLRDFKPSSVDCNEYDLIIICQLDILATYFLLQGKKVVIVQMYDGSGSLPDSYWQLNRQASFINFSLYLHTKALSQGCNSMLVRYAPDPQRFLQVRDFSTKRLFFWERRPNSPINIRSVSRLFCDINLDHVHLHLPRDDERGYDFLPEEEFGCNITTSKWFAEKKDFDEVFQRCNIFIAPRLSEGIGQSMLEAMARGMLVIAYDAPTHNEYVTNNVNGILFNSFDQKLSNFDWERKSENMGKNARAAIEAIHDSWLSQAGTIEAFILSAQTPSLPPYRAIQEFGINVINEYNKGIDSFSCFLASNPLMVNAIGLWPQMETRTIDNISDQNEDMTEMNLCIGRDQIGFDLGEGWSQPEDAHVWAIEKVANLSINSDLIRERGFYDIQVEMRSVESQLVKIEVEDKVISVQVGGVFERFFMPKVWVSDVSNIHFRFEAESVYDAYPDPRQLSFAIRSIKLSPASLGT